MPGKKIEYLDLAIHLPPSTEPKITEWINTFIDQYDYIVIAPKIKDALLKINSSDFIEFLGYLEPKKLTDFELKKIKSQANEQMKRLVQKAISSDIRYHYNWCLTAMANFKEGRHLRSS